jgi:predicted RNA-binding Zn-ribbon protein involved in translation (DUF1610 family)
MNDLNSAISYFTFQDDFVPVKILAGNHIFERLAPQRTGIIFGVTELPWAVAAYRIDGLIVQLEPNLDEVDAIALEDSGKARLIRDNAVIYELDYIIPPDITGLHSNFFYRCPECNGHIYECTHLRIGTHNPHEPPSLPSVVSEFTDCPTCGGKIQNLALGVSFCLDCDWEHGLEPITRQND